MAGRTATSPARVSQDVSVDMTPLIDVTFLLLAFFMIISVFNQMERTAELELPIIAQALIERDVAEQRMVVNVEHDGQIVLFGQRVDMFEFRQHLRKMGPTLRALGRQTGESALIIRGDKFCPFEHIRQVLSAIYEEDIRQVMFAAYEAEGSEVVE